MRAIGLDRLTERCDVRACFLKRAADTMAIDTGGEPQTYRQRTAADKVSVRGAKTIAEDGETCPMANSPGGFGNPRK